jgi:hypothetical protein
MFLIWINFKIETKDFDFLESREDQEAVYHAIKLKRICFDRCFLWHIAFPFFNFSQDSFRNDVLYIFVAFSLLR